MRETIQSIQLVDNNERQLYAEYFYSPQFVLLTNSLTVNNGEPYNEKQAAQAECFAALSLCHDLVMPAEREHISFYDSVLLVAGCSTSLTAVTGDRYSNSSCRGSHWYRENALMQTWT